MSLNFFSGDEKCGNLEYSNIRDHPNGASHKEFVESLWKRFNHLADNHFLQDSRNHFHQRFWEMYLGVTLIEQGFDLKKVSSAGPEFYTNVGKHRVWFEAIAPEPGNAADMVPPMIFGVGECNVVPSEKVLLRYTHALAEKQKKYTKARQNGLIKPEDFYVLAINGAGIRHVQLGSNYVQAFLPIGPPALAIDSGTGEIVASPHRYRPSIPKKNGRGISTRAFLETESSFCCAVLHSEVNAANYPERMGSDFSILHNPNANMIDANVFRWCEQFRVTDNLLCRSAADNINKT